MRWNEYPPVLLVGCGGILGALARYGLTLFIGRLNPGVFPWATFVINISGAFALGVIGTLAARATGNQLEPLRLFAGVGFLGAYTTFSTLSYDSYKLLEAGAWGPAFANVVLSPAAGLVAVWLGCQMAAR